MKAVSKEQYAKVAQLAWLAVATRHHGVYGPCPFGALPSDRPEVLEDYKQEVATRLNALQESTE